MHLTRPEGPGAEAALVSVSGLREHVGYTKFNSADPSGRYALALGAPWARAVAELLREHDQQVCVT